MLFQPLQSFQQALCDSLELSSTLLFALADTVNLPSIRGAVRAVESHLKDQGLNLLINNAGVSSHATLRSLDLQEMLSIFATNAVGPIQVAKVRVQIWGFSCLGKMLPMAKVLSAGWVLALSYETDRWGQDQDRGSPLPRGSPAPASPIESF